MNPLQQEAVAVADAHTNNVGMPTYTELREQLAYALRHLPVPILAALLPVLEKAGGSL